jgi:YD repeat-containing protein
MSPPSSTGRLRTPTTRTATSVRCGTTTFYTYDFDNRLTQSNIWNGTATTTTTYAYDPFGNRISQTASTTTTLYPSKYYSITTTANGTSTVATGTDFGDQGLGEPLRQPLTHQTRGDVSGASGGIPDDQAYRSRGIGLRPRNPRNGRKRGSTRCQMQPSGAIAAAGLWSRAICLNRGGALVRHDPRLNRIDNGFLRRRGVWVQIQTGHRRPMTTIGCARVSTTDQDLDIQVAALKREGCTTIRSEKRSGAGTANLHQARQRPHCRPFDLGGILLCGHDRGPAPAPTTHQRAPLADSGECGQ